MKTASKCIRAQTHLLTCQIELLLEINAVVPDGIVCRERLGGQITTFERAAA